MASRLPLPLFAFEIAVQKVRASKDGWYTRAEFFKGCALSELGL
jgi:nuclear transport factor 2 (NTF2) superfamily protein